MMFPLNHGVMAAQAAAQPPMSYEQTVLADNPFAYWRLKDTSGATAPDLSGNGHDGTYQGSYTLAQAPIVPGKDPAVHFDVSGYMDCSSFPSAGFSAITVEFWIRFTQTGDDYIISHDLSGGNTGDGSIRGGNLEFTTDGSYAVNGNRDIADDAPHHVIYSYDGAVHRFYVDGVLTGSLERSGDTIWNSAAPVQIGGILNGDSRYSIAALMADVAIYDYALSESQIAAHYVAGLPSELILSFSDDSASGSVGANQGVAFDGTHYFTTGGEGVTGLSGGINFNILKYDSGFNLVDSRDTTTDNGGVHEQVNGIYHDPASGKLYVGANNYSNSPVQGWIYEYNASDLSFIQAHDLGERWTEACVFYDGHWFTVSASEHAIVEFDETWALVQVHSLQGAGVGGLYWQAIFVINDIFYLNYHEPQNKLWAYKYEGGEFKLITTACVQPTGDCTQGVFRRGSVLYWAERDPVGSSNRVIQTNLPGGSS